jgi:hypothetical protein
MKKLYYTYILFPFVNGFNSRSGKTKDHEICICCFFDNQAIVRSKYKDCLARVKIMCLIGVTYSVYLPVDSFFSSDDFFQLFNWFLLFSSDKHNPKVAGHGENR